MSTASFSQVVLAEDTNVISQVGPSIAAAPGAANLKTTTEMEETMHLHHAGLICRRDAGKVKPTRGDCGVIDRVEMEQAVPASITTFLHSCHHGDLRAGAGAGLEADEESDAESDAESDTVDSGAPGPRRRRDRRPTWILAQGSDLLCTGSGGKVVTQKHLGLANSVCLKTHSKALLNELAELGHCVGCEHNVRMRTTMANDAVARAAATPDGQTFVPPNIVKVADDPGVGKVLHSAIDNFNTPDGLNATTGIIRQTQPATLTHHVVRRECGATEKFTAPLFTDALVPMPVTPNKEGPPVGTCDALTGDAACGPLTTGCASTVGMFAPPTQTWRPKPAAHAARHRDEELLHSLCGAKGARCPSRTGCNQTLETSRKGLCDTVDVVGQMPSFHGEAHEHKTQHTVIARIKATRDVISPGSNVVVACDQDVCRGVKDLQWAMPNVYSDVVATMGTLHIMIHWMKVVFAKHLEDSGVVDLLSGTDHYGAGHETERQNTIIKKGGCARRSLFRQRVCT